MDTISLIPSSVQQLEVGKEYMSRLECAGVPKLGRCSGQAMSGTPLAQDRRQLEWNQSLTY
jgi:hypothetical protein